MRNRAEIIALIIASATEIQVASGRSSDGITEDSQLFGGVDGFDSLNGLEVLVLVGAQLEAEFSHELLQPTKTGDPVTIGVLADRILSGCDDE